MFPILKITTLCCGTIDNIRMSETLASLLAQHIANICDKTDSAPTMTSQKHSKRMSNNGQSSVRPEEIHHEVRT